MSNIVPFPKPQYFKLTVRQIIDYDEPTSGCYEHLWIPARITLKELADIINDEFGMAEGRAHAFFMDNRSFSSVDCYYDPMIADDPEYGHDGFRNQYRRTPDYRLCDALMGNPVPQKFRMIDRYPERKLFSEEEQGALMVEDMLNGRLPRFEIMEGLVKPEKIKKATEEDIAGMKGKKFKYVYSMGHTFVYQCRVLRVEERDLNR